MAVLPEISPACREELERAGFKAGVAYLPIKPLTADEQRTVAHARAVSSPGMDKLLAIIDRLTGGAL